MQQKFLLYIHGLCESNIIMTSQACAAPPPLPRGSATLVHYFVLFTLIRIGSILCRIEQGGKGKYSDNCRMLLSPAFLS